jgi:uncharacterized membrane protein
MINTDDNTSEILGRKVFFLYPHSVIQNDMINILVKNEYEVYVINNDQMMFKTSKLFPNAILFINIDEKLSENEWQDYIKNILNNDKQISRIGILTYNKDKNLAQKYLMEIMVPCGFIVLSISLEQSASTILKMLQVNEAKGRRKFLRASNLNSENTKFNLVHNGSVYTGLIADISIGGMAIVFDDDVSMDLKTFFKDIQIQLKGIICRTQGTIVAKRNNDDGGYVLLFQNSDEQTRNKVHNFIYNHLQISMQNILKDIK